MGIYQQKRFNMTVWKKLNQLKLRKYRPILKISPLFMKEAIGLWR